MLINEKVAIVLIIVSSFVFTGCIAKDVKYTDQQKRMQRCEQYIDREREQCLRGDYITLEEYKDDFEAYKKSKEKEAEKEQFTLPEKPVSDVKPTVSADEKPKSK